MSGPPRHEHVRGDLAQPAQDARHQQRHGRGDRAQPQRRRATRHHVTGGLLKPGEVGQDLLGTGDQRLAGRGEARPAGGAVDEQPADRTFEPLHSLAALITSITALHQQQREAELDKRRGHRPRNIRSGAGRRPTLTLADRLLATVLHHRHALPQVAVAALFNVRPETINKRIRDTRDLLNQAGHTIEPTQQPLATLDDLYDLARTEGITVPTRTTTAS
jgi:hypothetical protein